MPNNELDSFKKAFLYQMNVKLSENTRSVTYSTSLGAQRFTEKYLSTIKHIPEPELRILKRRIHQIVMEFLNSYEKHLLSFVPKSDK